MKIIQEVLNLKERKVLVRLDLNVPLGVDGAVEDDEAVRVKASLETLRHLKAAGAKTIVISHIGRDKKESLKPVADYLQKFMEIRFVPTLEPEVLAGVVANLAPGDIVLLENLRQNEEEEKHDEQFAAFLASLADMYVNDAFAVSHREHASIVGVPKYLPSYAGFQMQKEVENLGRALKNPEHPFLFILGGAKFETKIPLLQKFEHLADEILIGGALANNFFKTIGFEVGKSLVDKDYDMARFFNHENIKIPFDVVTKAGQKDLASMGKDDIIADIGPETIEEWKKSISGAKTILWNGPLGLYEEGFDKASKELVSAIANSGAFSIIGGGDTATLVKDMNLESKISFVSTGGGAMLEFLATGTLPGIQALENPLS